MSGRTKHRAIAVGWMALFVPALLMPVDWQYPFLIFVSLWALASTHWDIATTADDRDV